MPSKKRRASSKPTMIMQQPLYDSSIDRGKALASIAIGLLLISFGLEYITFGQLALVSGVVYCLKGVVKMMTE
jgi:hypothetical protein